MVEALPLDITYEDLQAHKLARISSSLDKRELSLINLSTAANSYEAVQMLVTLATFAELMFAETAPREELIKLATERGLTPEPATKAKLRGVFNIDVPLGARFSLDELNYTVTEQIAPGEFIVECETVGEIGNKQLGTLIPIDYIDGLTSAELVEVLIPGEDEEDTEVFRQRYFDSFNSVAFAGNRAHYKVNVKKLEGVGGVKVYRAWNGGGTVKLVIIDSTFKKPSSVLVESVQEQVDPLSAQGEGLGLAPIDHIVTVYACEETTIDIISEITLQTGYVWEDIEDEVHRVIDSYFTEMAQEWANSSTKQEDHTGLVVRISQIEYRLLGVNGILDIANTTLNGMASNIELPNENIPKRGDVSG